MKRAMRDRLARPADDHGTSVDTHGSSSTQSKTTASTTHVTTVSSSAMNAKNTVLAGSSHSTTGVLSDLNVSALLGQWQSWTGPSGGLQHSAAAGHHDQSSVNMTSSSSSSLHSSDSSGLLHRPTHFDQTGSSLHAHRHWCLIVIYMYWIMILFIAGSYLIHVTAVHLLHVNLQPVSCVSVVLRTTCLSLFLLPAFLSLLGQVKQIDN